MSTPLELPDALNDPQRDPQRLRLLLVREVAKDASAALDKVLVLPTEANRDAALAALYAYLAATEYLCENSQPLPV